MHILIIKQVLIHYANRALTQAKMMHSSQSTPSSEDECGTYFTAPIPDTAIATFDVALVESNKEKHQAINLDALFDTPPVTPEETMSAPAPNKDEAGPVETPLSSKSGDDLVASWAAEPVSSTLKGKGKIKSATASVGIFGISKSKTHPIVRKVTVVSQVPAGFIKDKVAVQVAQPAIKRKVSRIEEQDNGETSGMSQKRKKGQSYKIPPPKKAPVRKRTKADIDFIVADEKVEKDITCGHPQEVKHKMAHTSNVEDEDMTVAVSNMVEKAGSASKGKTGLARILSKSNVGAFRAAKKKGVNRVD